MAIAFDTDSDGTQNSSNTLTFSHTCTGEGLVLIVSVGWWENPDAARTVSGVTYNGVSMTSAVSQTTGTPDTARGTEIFYLAIPAIGANDVVVTMSSTTDAIQGNAASFTGCDVDDPIGDTTAGTALSIVVDTDRDNSFVVDNVQNLDANCASISLTVGASQTQMANQCANSGTGASRQAVSREATTTKGAVTMSWSGTADNPIHCGVEVHEGVVGVQGGVMIF